MDEKLTAKNVRSQENNFLCSDVKTVKWHRLSTQTANQEVKSRKKVNEKVFLRCLLLSFDGDV